MTPADVQAPIPLSAAMLEAIRTWAADDRLWGSRSTTEFNLCTFARVILKAAQSPIDVQALEALRDQWRVDAEAKHRAEYQDNQVVREAFPRITTIEIRRWLKCAEDLDVLIHGAGGQEKENTE